MEQAFTFGWLDGLEDVIEFDAGRIEPIHPTSEARRAMMGERLNVDGWIYPPTTRQRRVELDAGPVEVVANTARPAEAFRLPATHRLAWRGRMSDERRRVEPYLFLKVVGCWHGAMLNFEDWWNFHRLRHRAAWRFHVLPREVGPLLSAAALGIGRLSSSDAEAVIAALTLAEHGRACREAWEQLMWQWTAVERIGAVVMGLLESKASTSSRKERTPGLADVLAFLERHDPQFRQAASKYAAKERDRWARAPETARELIELRNDVVHRGVWGPDAMVFGGSRAIIEGAEALGRLLERLLLVLLGIECGFRTSPWLTPQVGATYSLGLA